MSKAILSTIDVPPPLQKIEITEITFFAGGESSELHGKLLYRSQKLEIVKLTIYAFVLSSCIRSLGHILIKEKNKAKPTLPFHLLIVNSELFERLREVWLEAENNPIPWLMEKRLTALIAVFLREYQNKWVFMHS
ncbi:hypothetical protein EGR_04770 [Echinococcus granulosus]|uniref:Uncharacterized protein n=1 Tax=Echinococcus granulosus TaxID=6210 RepID=W6UH72_ECHGR|nr:hypothetical protein EGR_04770 [Echinococcus granulosus]EUB60388.1 hypothetical protein EGR_04770 [Echinococcus granulosus]